jgi:hypothetical protein
VLDLGLGILLGGGDAIPSLLAISNGDRIPAGALGGWLRARLGRGLVVERVGTLPPRRANMRSSLIGLVGLGWSRNSIRREGQGGKDMHRSGCRSPVSESDSHF